MTVPRSITMERFGVHIWFSVFLQFVYDSANIVAGEIWAIEQRQDALVERASSLCDPVSLSQA